MTKAGFYIFVIALFALASASAQSTCKCGLPIDNSFQVAPMTMGHGSDVGVPPLYENNNATTPAMALPFSFCFYNRSFDSVYISNNGIISFTRPIYAFIDSTQRFPLGADTLMIAPFYADASTLNNTGVVYYKITPTYMAVIWDSLRYAGSDVDGWNTFQLIITNGTDPIVPDGNNIAFCYPVMQWSCSDSSGGFSGYGGTPAFVGINKGDGTGYAQISRFGLPGDFYYGPFSTMNGVDWLDFQSFTFNSCVTGDLIAPVIANDHPACNKLYICPCDTTETASALGAQAPCDTLNLVASFICAEPGQTAVLSYSVTGSLNIYSVYTSTGIIDSIIVQAIPAFGDTGTQVLTLTATDTVHHLQSTLTYTIDVTTFCLTAGITDLKGGNDFSVYPNPASTGLTIHYNDALGNTVVKMYDELGAEVYSGTLSPDRSDIDVSKFDRGLYFVELFKDGEPLSAKKIMLL